MVINIQYASTLIMNSLLLTYASISSILQLWSSFLWVVKLNGWYLRPKIDGCWPRNRISNKWDDNNAHLYGCFSTKVARLTSFSLSSQEVCYFSGSQDPCCIFAQSWEMCHTVGWRGAIARPERFRSRSSKWKYILYTGILFTLAFFLYCAKAIVVTSALPRNCIFYIVLCTLRIFSHIIYYV